MEENFRPASPDLAAAERCRNELTRTYSDSSSITVDNSKDFVRQNTNVRPEIQHYQFKEKRQCIGNAEFSYDIIGDGCTAWTDEKHNSYLNALEASFVKKLHHSWGLLSRCSKQNTSDPSPSRQLPANASYSSDQFTVLQDGSCQKINFERKQPLPYSVAGSHVVIESSPWIRHFTCSGKHSTIKSADFQECSIFHCDGEPLRGKRIFSHGLTSLGQQCVCHKCDQDAVGTITEVSDQNFVDEDWEEKSICLPKGKKLMMATTDASTKDQIVPAGNPITAKSSTAGNALPQRGASAT